MKRNVKMKKDRKKKKKEKRKKMINEYIKKIKKHYNKLWCPKNNIKFKKKKLNTWFNIETSKSIVKNTFNMKFKINDPETLYKCKKIEMHLNSKQKSIFNKWFDSYELMYNQTLRLIKKRRIEGKKGIYNFRTLRTNYLKDAKINILNFYNKNKKEVAKGHNLDFAIKLACANYKSALTNYRNGNIKHFRIRYWKHRRQNKIMDIEDQYFKQTGLCYRVFGKINCTYDKKEFDLGSVNTTSKMMYDRQQNKYYLFVPEKLEPIKIKKKRKIISCDPGIRTFITGITENHVIKIGDNCSKRIKKYLKIVDKRANMNIPNKIKKKNEKIYNRKITGLVDELHWKTIQYLTKNHQRILIGDMSVKGITRRCTSNLNKITKRIAYKLKFYKFRQRLKYKCKALKKSFEVINESYTSKICSMCGYIKNNLGSSKTYNCNNCKTVMDRDVNGARGIFIKSLH